MKNIIWKSLEKLLNTALKFAFRCYSDLLFVGLLLLLCNLHVVGKCTPKPFNCFYHIVRSDCLGKQREEIHFITAI